MTEAAHAFLAPSAAPRWVLCAGSALMESLYPDLGDDTKAREGTACHWVMDSALRMYMGGPSITEGTIAPNGVVVTREMLEAVHMLAEDVQQRLGPRWASMVTVERPLTVPRVHAQCWGTPDVRAWVEQPNGRRLLIVWDLKFGFKRVEAFENYQGVAYMAGCLSEANDVPAPAFPESQVDCLFVIVQPRAYHPDGPVRTWATTATGLREYVHRMSMAADEATGPTPVCRPQPDACENCRARANCDALQEAAYRGMDIARQATPRELSTTAAGLELALLDDVKGLIEARVSGLEEVVKHRLQQGERVPFWHYAPGRGATNWTKPDAEVIALGNMLGLTLHKPKVVTPLQAIKAGLPESLASKYSEKVPGATVLTRTDGSETRKIFSLAP